MPIIKPKINESMSEEVIDQDTINDADELISNLSKSNQKKGKDKKKDKEPVKSVDFGRIEQTNPIDDEILGDLSTPVNTSNKTPQSNSYNQFDIGRKLDFGESNQNDDIPIEEEKEPEPIEEKKPKKKVKASTIFTGIIVVVLFVCVLGAALYPVIGNNLSISETTNGLISKITGVFSKNNEVDEENINTSIIGVIGEDTPNNEVVISSESKLPPIDANSLTIEEGVKEIGNINSAISSYMNEVVSVVINYKNNAEESYVEENIKPISNSIIQDLANLDTYYRQIFLNNNAVDLYDNLKDRMNNVYMLCSTTYNTMTLEALIDNTNSYIETENRKSAESIPLIQKLLDDNGIENKVEDGKIIYIPLATKDNAVQQTIGSDETYVGEANLDNTNNPNNDSVIID